jgi:hypothetical protein
MKPCLYFWGVERERERERERKRDDLHTRHYMQYPYSLTVHLPCIDLGVITYFNFSNFVSLRFYAAVVMNNANPAHQL